MNWLGACSILMGISYLIYSIIFRNKVTLYFKGIKIIEGSEQKYFKLQLYFSVLNSLIVVSTGIVIITYNFNTVYLLVIPLLFHLINFGMKLIGRLNGYIET